MTRAPGVVIGSPPGFGARRRCVRRPAGGLSAFAAIELLRGHGSRRPDRSAVVNFVDKEGARFGVACAGSRLITGAMTADARWRCVTATASTMAEAMAVPASTPGRSGADDETLRRIGVFVELHVEQGRGLVDLGRAVAVGSSIWPHGRWRIDLPGEANHAGTTAAGRPSRPDARPGRS